MVEGEFDGRRGDEIMSRAPEVSEAGLDTEGRLVASAQAG